MSQAYKKHTLQADNRRSDRTMAAMKLALSTRIKYLQSLRDHTTEEAVQAAVTTAASNFEHSIERYPGTFDLPTATSLIELISEDPTLFSQASRRQIIEKVNAKLVMGPGHYDGTLLPVVSTVKQTMLHPENYFTEAIWRGLLDDEASKADVYMQICAVLVRCGLFRPQETFWGILVATLQWASNDPEFDPAQVRDVMKRIWKSCRLILPTDLEGPTEYPKLPADLLETHPDVYHRAYPHHELPMGPPKHLDYLRLNFYRTTTGSRITKRPLLTGATKTKLWHFMALETRWCSEKLRPQRPPGEVKLLGVHATRITRRGPSGA